MSADPAPLARTPRPSRWSAPIDWLRNVPVADPVDRRNAPMLQVLSLLLAVLPTLAWMYRAFGTELPWRPGEIDSMLLGLTLSAVAAVSFVLIRYGKFQWASRQLLAVFAVTLILAYAASGFTAQRFEQPVLVICMAVAGLLVARSALWFMYACVLAAFAVGVYVDAGKSREAALLAGDGVISAMMFLLIAVVMDRSVTAFRESLRDATERGNELASANARLHAEIIAREKAQEQLIHAQKVEAMGRLASGVAHDFGNLLGLVLGYAAKGRRAVEPEEIQQSLAGVESAARRAKAIAQKLLNFSRQDDTRPERFDPAAALEEVKPMLRQLFDPSVQLGFDLAGDAPPIHFDRAQFELMVLNIAANANQAMPHGGRFDLLLRSDRPASAIVIEFRDTGSGMAAEVQARIFEPFFTTKPNGQGTGLGLSVARDLIETARGSISVDSAIGAGTTVRVRLPASV